MKVMFEREESCGKIFKELKERLTSGPVLSLPKCDENGNVYSDSSRVSFGCVLMEVVRL